MSTKTKESLRIVSQEEIGKGIFSMWLQADRMAEAARILSKDFKFVRVDLYDVDGKPFFGEMTFTPAGGFDVSQCRINGQSMGELLKI